MRPRTLAWHIVYGGWRATGHDHDYLVARFMGHWATFCRDHTTVTNAPFALLPYSSYRTRREAQLIAEDHEVKQLCKVSKLI